jgi:hypothetical protein
MDSSVDSTIKKIMYLRVYLCAWDLVRSGYPCHRPSSHPHFLYDNQLTERAVRLSALHTGRPLSPGRCLVHISAGRVRLTTFAQSVWADCLENVGASTPLKEPSSFVKHNLGKCILDYMRVWIRKWSTSTKTVHRHNTAYERECTSGMMYLLMGDRPLEKHILFSGTRNTHVLCWTTFTQLAHTWPRKKEFCSC